jgi:hypothetical protein
MIRRFPSGIAYKDTKHGASRFVRCSPETLAAAQLWDTFVQAWALVYLGMPDEVKTDRGTQFITRDFELVLSYHAVKQQYTAIVPHLSLGANERAHARSSVVFISKRAEAIQNFHTSWHLRTP